MISMSASACCVMNQMAMKSRHKLCPFRGAWRRVNVCLPDFVS